MAVIRDPMSLPGRRTTIYPAEYAAGFDKRLKRPLGDVGGLTQFGVNLTTLEPGAMSALRHWHKHEDEFVFVVAGEVTLITDAGEEVLASCSEADAMRFPRGHRAVWARPAMETALLFDRASGERIGPRRH